MVVFAVLRRLDERVLGPAPAAVHSRRTVLPYVLAGVVCAGVPAFAVVLAGGSLRVAALLPALGLLPLGIALLTRPPAGKHLRR